VRRPMCTWCDCGGERAPGQAADTGSGGGGVAAERVDAAIGTVVVETIDQRLPLPRAIGRGVITTLFTFESRVSCQPARI
jgi:hypothetical protein